MEEGGERERERERKKEKREKREREEGRRILEKFELPGNRATFARIPRLFGDSCANLFRARNPICLRLIVSPGWPRDPPAFLLLKIVQRAESRRVLLHDLLNDRVSSLRLGFSASNQA